MATKSRLTAEDLWRMPDDEVRRELINGEVVEMPLTQPPHGRLVSLMAYFLVDHVRKHGGGEVVSGGATRYDSSPHDLGLPKLPKRTLRFGILAQTLSGQDLTRGEACHWIEV